VLLAAYGDVLATWSRVPRFTINVPFFNRRLQYPGVDALVGQFASFTLLSVDVTEGGPFAERARALQRQLWSDLEHAAVSGVEVTREWRRARGARGAALFPVVFTSVPSLAPVGEGDGEPQLGEVVYEVSQTPQVLLDLVVSERSDGLVYRWNSLDDQFLDGVQREMFEAYGRLLRRLAEDDAAWQGTWADLARGLASPGERWRRVSCNGTATPVQDQPVHTLVREQALRQPDGIAIIAPGRTLHYGEVWARARALGRRLRALGAAPNTLVALVMQKGWEEVVGVLGVMVSGAAYLPLDPTWPSDRLRALLEHGGVRLVLTQSRLAPRIEWPGRVHCVSVDREEPERGETELDTVQGPDDLAYVMYTSGSTGAPKGVMIAHRGVVNAIVDTNARFGLGAGDRLLAVTSLVHDMSVYDIFGTLAAGGVVVIPGADARRDPAAWAALVMQEGVTVWNSVPALLGLLLDHAERHPEVSLRSLRLVFLGGDWIPLRLPSRLRATAGDVRIVSVGGPTETTVWNIVYPLESVQPGWRSIPYGRPLANTKYYVLNDALESCPTWVPGEMHCAGVGLAKGYWRDEERTRASFFHHPRTGERLYRTGDIGRYLPDGNIELLGRADDQVKLQGNRVELGEIEGALRAHPSVSAAVVAVRLGPHGDPRLVAYVVAAGPGGLNVGELRDALCRMLPEIMVPSAFLEVETFPLSENGKIDRQALPDPPWTARPESASGHSSATSLAAITEVITSVLGLPSVEASANLLSLGATSIDMIRITNLLDDRLDFRPSIDEFYAEPTALALAASYNRKSVANMSGGVVETPGVTLPTTPLSALTALGPLLVDPEERAAFVCAQRGLRQESVARHTISLARGPAEGELAAHWARRRSWRAFRREPVPFAQFGQFLGCLRQLTIAGRPKFFYPSGGGLYPVQTYLAIKGGRVEGVEAGTYYHHPVDHNLVALTPGAEIDPGVYSRLVNRPVFEQAAFGIFLIAQLTAIAPVYGDRSVYFATLEAGYMGQLLMMVAPDTRIGLCPIGTLEFERLRHLFMLDDGHVLVHSMVGGLVDLEHGARPEDPAWEEGEL
jgi:amino acid adenylation domain-containing protein